MNGKTSCGLASQFFAGDATKTALWFQTKNPLLGNISPRDTIRYGRYEKLRRFVMSAMEENAKTAAGQAHASPAASTASEHAASRLALQEPDLPSFVELERFDQHIPPHLARR